MDQGNTLPEERSEASFPLIPHNFLALPQEQASIETSPVVLVPVPYDSTTSFKSGSREGPEAMIKASYGLEDYDFELGVKIL